MNPNPPNPQLYLIFKNYFYFNNKMKIIFALIFNDKKKVFISQQNIKINELI